MSFESASCVRRLLMTCSCSRDVSKLREAYALFVEVVWQSVFVVGQGYPATQTFGHCFSFQGICAAVNVAHLTADLGRDIAANLMFGHSGGILRLHHEQRPKFLTHRHKATTQLQLFPLSLVGNSYSRHFLPFGSLCALVLRHIICIFIFSSFSSRENIHLSETTQIALLRNSQRIFVHSFIHVFGNSKTIPQIDRFGAPSIPFKLFVEQEHLSFLHHITCPGGSDIPKGRNHT
jgi:hypothetical protein